MSRNSGRDSRRSFIKQVAFSTAGVSSIPVITTAKNDEWDEFTLPEGEGFETEKEIISSLSGMVLEDQPSGETKVKINRSVHPELTKEENKHLAQLRQRTRTKALQGIREKIRSPSSEKTSVETDSITASSDLPKITVGNDETLSNIFLGTEDQSHSGDLVIHEGGKKANLIEDQAEAALVCSGGAGSATRMAAVGSKFEVNGTGDVTINANGWYNGALTASDASTEARIFFELQDQTRGSYITPGSDIFSKSFGGYNAHDTGQTYYSQPLHTTLNDGHTYFAYVAVEATVSSNGIGEASSDFGPQDDDSDNPDQCAYVKNFHFTF